jgi:hypothetical protein
MSKELVDTTMAHFSNQGEAPANFVCAHRLVRRAPAGPAGPAGGIRLAPVATSIPIEIRPSGAQPLTSFPGRYRVRFRLRCLAFSYNVENDIAIFAIARF